MLESNMDEENRFVSPQKKDVDADVENVLRPKSIDNYIGQTKAKENLRVYIDAAKKRKETLDHVLLYGPPGLGKTTLSYIIANELGVQMRTTSGPAIERAGDLAAILTNLSEGDVLFIDEIHRLNHSVEEILYPAMEDYSLDFIVGKGPSAKSMRLPLPKFTLIGATTRAGMLTSPLRDRFGVILRLEMYNENELCEIIERSANVLKMKIEHSAAMSLSKRSRGTPRIANRLLKRVRDFADIKSDGVVTSKVCDYALNAMDVDKLGLDMIDIKLLTTLIDKFGGGPCGLDTISAAINEDSNTIEDVYEPYLIQLGFISRTPRGRVCLPLAYKHLGRSVKNMQTDFLGEDNENH